MRLVAGGAGLTQTHRKSVLAAAGVALFLIGMLSVFSLPGRMNLGISFASVGAGRLVVPVAYWAALVLWTWIAARLCGRDAVGRALAVAFFVHVSLLLAQFAPRVSDRGQFSSGFYWAYSRLFLAVALAGATAWTMTLVSHLRRDAASILEVPIAISTAVLATAIGRYDPLAFGCAAVAGLSVGGVLIAADSGPGFSERLRTAVTRIWYDERLFLTMVFVLAITLRLLYSRRVMTDPDFIEIGADGAAYDRLAWSLAQGHGIPEAFRVVYPLLLLGYVRFVAAIYTLMGHSYFAVCAVQSLLGSVACLGIFSIARSVFGSTVARITAVFTAISFQLIFAAAALGHQALDVVLTVTLVWVLLDATSKRSVRWFVWVGIGIAFGCAIAVRETNVFFLSFVLVWIPFALERSNALFARSWRPLIAVTAGVVVVLLPVIMPAVATADARWRLRQHLDRLWFYDDLHPRREGGTAFVNPHGALMQFEFAPARAVIRARDAIIKNFATQFFTQPYGGFDLFFLMKNTNYAYVMWSYAYALAAIGFVVAGVRAVTHGRRAAPVALIIGVVLFRTLPHLFMESEYRHRAPIEPFLILLAAVGAVRLFGDIRRGAAPGDCSTSAAG